MVGHGVTQEGPFPRSVNGAFGFVDLELQPPIQKPGQRRQHPFPRPPRPHIDVTVVGIAAEGVATAFQFLVQIVEQDIRQQRRQRPALGRPLCPLCHGPARHQSGPQVPADQAEYPLVPDLAPHPCHQHVVVHPVKELLQVHVDHPAPARSHLGLGRENRLVGAPSGPEPVGGTREVRIENRHQHLMQRLLDQPIQNRWNAEKAHSLAAGLGYFYLAHRRRFVPTVQQVFLDGGPMFPQVRHQGLDWHVVHARRSLVRHHPTVSRQHVVATDNQFHQSLIRLRSGVPPVRRDP